MMRFKIVMLDFNESKTLGDIYRSKEIDPSELAIFMVLDGGMRIPISRKYDHVPFKDALKEIAETLRDQTPQKVYIGNILDGKGYDRNSIHHFEYNDRDFANKVEKYYKLDGTEEIALRSSPDETKENVTESNPNTTISNQNAWLRTVYELYLSIDKKTKALSGFEETAACIFLATVLQYIRKNDYSTLQTNPEDFGGIPKNIFACIDEYIKQNQAIILGDKAKDLLITPEFIKAVERKLNANSLEPFQHLMSVDNKDTNSATQKLSNYNQVGFVNSIGQRTKTPDTTDQQPTTAQTQDKQDGKICLIM